MATRDSVRKAIDSELLFTAVLLLVSVLVLLRTLTIRITATADEFGPRTLPQVIAVLLIIWSLFQMIRLFRLRYRDWSQVDAVIEEADADIGVSDLLVEVGEGSAQIEEVLSLAVEDLGQEVAAKPAFDWLPSPPSRVSKRLVMSLALITYVVVMQVVGFLVSTALFVGIGLWLFSEESRLVMIALPLMLSGGLYVLFEYLLHVRLP